MRAIGEPAMRIEDALGVCCVREDTRLLAAMTHAVIGGSGRSCRGLDSGTGSGYIAIYLALRGWQNTCRSAAR